MVDTIRRKSAFSELVINSLILVAGKKAKIADYSPNCSPIIIFGLKLCTSFASFEFEAYKMLPFSMQHVLIQFFLGILPEFC
jgi:hypothetical protein